QEHPLLARGAAALGVLVGHGGPVTAVPACVADLVAERARVGAEVDARAREPETRGAREAARDPLAVPRLVDVHDRRRLRLLPRRRRLLLLHRRRLLLLHRLAPAVLRSDAGLQLGDEALGLRALRRRLVEREKALVGIGRLRAVARLRAQPVRLAEVEQQR